MLFVLICTYLGVWACAYAAVHAWRGKLGFWILYAVALAGVPVVSGAVLGVIFSAANPAYGATITPLSMQFGILLALVVYPVKYLRAKVEE